MTESPRVLLVQADPDQTTLFTLLLLQERYEVLAVPDAAAALAQLDARPFDLLITDWHLPDQPGDALIRTWHARSPSTRTLLMSGDALGQAAEECGADAWLPKPLDIGHFLGLVSALLRRQAPGTTPPAR